MVTARLRSSSAFFYAFLFSALITGCSNQTSSKSPSFAMTRHGSVHGGQQPVSGATLQLYAVGTTGDGSTATPLLSSTTSGADGSFDITGKYTCPTGASLVYIVATGGNPGLTTGTNNSALDMMSVLGRCDSLTASTFIVINEATTVAAVSALSPFMTSPSAVGSATADASALANAFALASAFVNTSTGTSPGLNVPAGTAVPEAKINSLANVVTSCVNSSGGAANDGSACGTLFTLTTVSGQTPPTNIITALGNVANNPALNTAALFNLAPSAAPYQPTLTTAPADFSIQLLSTVGASSSGSGPVTLSPTSLTFYQTNVPQTVTMTNTGQTPVAIQNINISSSNWSQTNDCGTVLPAQSICTINVQSTNSTLGTFSGTLTVVDDDTNDAQVVQLNTDNETLVGTIDFGSWSIGSSGTRFPLAGVLTGSVSGSNPGDFSFASDWQGPLPVPFTCQGLGGRSGPCNNLYFFFTPTTVGTRSALLTTNLGTYLLTGTGLKHGPYFSFDSGNYDFGSTAAGSQTPLPLVITSYGDAPVTLLPPVIGGTNASDFAVTSTCTVIPAATSGYLEPPAGHLYIQRAGARSTCTLNVTFTPSADGSRSATLTETDSVGLQQTVTLTGSGASSSPPTANPASLSFGNVQSGMTASQSVTVTSANQAAVTAQISGSNNYTVQPATCAQGATTCTFTVTFAPTASGAINGVLTLSSQGSLTTTSVPLTGSGIAPAVSLSPTSLSFPARNIGTTSLAQTVTLTNTGLASLHISNVSLTTTNLGEFSSSGTCSASAVIAAGQTCTLSVSFAPQITGTKTGLLQIFSDAFTSPDTIQLSGVAQ